MLETVDEAVGDAGPARPGVNLGALLTGPHVPGQVGQERTGGEVLR